MLGQVRIGQVRSGLAKSGHIRKTSDKVKVKIRIDQVKVTLFQARSGQVASGQITSHRFRSNTGQII